MNEIKWEFLPKGVFKPTMPHYNITQQTAVNQPPQDSTVWTNKPNRHHSSSLHPSCLKRVRAVCITETQKCEEGTSCTHSDIHSTYRRKSDTLVHKWRWMDGKTTCQTDETWDVCVKEYSSTWLVFRSKVNKRGGYTSVMVLFHDILKKILNKVILWISFSCDTLILTVTVVI